MLYLASQSPRRRELLARLGIPFQCQAMDIDESQFDREPPNTYVLRLAQAKAQALSDQLNCDAQANNASENPSAKLRNNTSKGHGLQSPWILAGDTCVALGEKILGKPENTAEAEAMLHSLSGHTHHVYTSIALLNNTHCALDCVVSAVTFGTLSAAEISLYCQSDEPYDKAGSYGIQGAAGAFIEHLDGDYSAVMGLPLWASKQLLAKAGLYPHAE